mgnify:FL=1
MGQCVIQSKRRRNIDLGSKDRPVIRIRPGEYSHIARIADQTGWTITEVASRLLASALEDVVIQYPDDEVITDA